MAMKYVSAYLMNALGGKENPSKKEIERTLASVGIDSEGEVIDALLKAVEGKSAHELISEGLTKLQAVPTGGGAGAAPAAAAAGGAAAAGKADAAAAAKKEEPKEEEEEEDDMGFSLFD